MGSDEDSCSLILVFFFLSVTAKERLKGEYTERLGGNEF